MPVSVQTPEPDKRPSGSESLPDSPPLSPPKFRRASSLVDLVQDPDKAANEPERLQLFAKSERREDGLVQLLRRRKGSSKPTSPEPGKSSSWNGSRGSTHAGDRKLADGNTTVRKGESEELVKVTELQRTTSAQLARAQPFVVACMVLGKLLTSSQKRLLPYTLAGMGRPQAESLNRYAISTAALLLTWGELAWLGSMAQPLVGQLPLLAGAAIGAALLNITMACGVGETMHSYTWATGLACHIAIGASVALIRQVGVEWALYSRMPRTPYKLLGGALSNAMSIIVLCSPIRFGPIQLSALLLGVAALGGWYAAASIRTAADTEGRLPTELPKTIGRTPSMRSWRKSRVRPTISAAGTPGVGKDSGESLYTAKIPWGTSIMFLAVAIVGLNGEQILDEVLNFRIRLQVQAGDNAQGIARHSAMLFACALAWFSERVIASRRRNGYAFFIVAWMFTQLLRVVAMGVGVREETSSGLVAFLVILDKYTTSLGESALEYALFLLCRDSLEKSGERHPREPRQTRDGVPVGLLFALYFVAGKVTKIVCQRLVADVESKIVLELIVLVLTMLTTAAILFILRREETKRLKTPAATDRDNTKQLVSNRTSPVAGNDSNRRSGVEVYRRKETTSERCEGGSGGASSGAGRDPRRPIQITTNLKDDYDDDDDDKNALLWTSGVLDDDSDGYETPRGAQGEILDTFETEGVKDVQKRLAELKLNQDPPVRGPAAEPKVGEQRAREPGEILPNIKRSKAMDIAT